MALWNAQHVSFYLAAALFLEAVASYQKGLAGLRVYLPLNPALYYVLYALAVVGLFATIFIGFVNFSFWVPVVTFVSAPPFGILLSQFIPIRSVFGRSLVLFVSGVAAFGTMLALTS